MSTRITQDEEGKPVVDANGNDIGIIASVQEETAHVNIDPGLAEKVKSQLGWEEASGDTYPIQPEMIASISTNEVQLQHRLSAE